MTQPNQGVAQQPDTLRDALERYLALHGWHKAPSGENCVCATCEGLLETLATPDSVQQQTQPSEPRNGDGMEAALSWALDMLDRYDARLAQIDAPDLVYSAIHLEGKAKARRALAESRCYRCAALGAYVERMAARTCTWLRDLGENEPARGDCRATHRESLCYACAARKALSGTQPQPASEDV